MNLHHVPEEFLLRHLPKRFHRCLGFEYFSKPSIEIEEPDESPKET
jgi:hypothetical protein